MFIEDFWEELPLYSAITKINQKNTTGLKINLERKIDNSLEYLFKGKFLFSDNLQVNYVWTWVNDCTKKLRNFCINFVIWCLCLKVFIENCKFNNVWWIYYIILYNYWINLM